MFTRQAREQAESSAAESGARRHELEGSTARCSRPDKVRSVWRSWMVLGTAAAALTLGLGLSIMLGTGNTITGRVSAEGPSISDSAIQPGLRLDYELRQLPPVSTR